MKNIIERTWKGDYLIDHKRKSTLKDVEFKNGEPFKIRLIRKVKSQSGTGVVEWLLFIIMVIAFVCLMVKWHNEYIEQVAEIKTEYLSPTAGIIYYMSRLEYYSMQFAEPIEIQELPVNTVKNAEEETLPDLVKPVHVYDIPDGEGVCDSSVRTYMDYRSVTSRRSKQYDVLNNGAYTDDATGIRMNNGRYCVAVGLGYGKAGDILDLVMEDDRILECIVGDVKAPQHCDPTNRYQKYDGSVVELIVDKTYYKKSPQFFNQHIQEIWKYE